MPKPTLAAVLRAVRSIPAPRLPDDDRCDSGPARTDTKETR